MNCKIFICLIALIQLSSAYYSTTSTESTWDYDHPEFWHIDYPECGKNYQSPINIETENFVLDTDKDSSYIFKNYDQKATFSMTLTENNIGFKLMSDKKMYVEINGVEYHFVSGKFSWAADNFHGSEHTIGGYKYPLELQLLHKNANDDQAIFAILFDISEESGDSEIRKFTNRINKNLKVNVPTDVKNVKLNSFTIRDFGDSEYYQYDGSLTTPPCTENVHVTVFKHLAKISEEQMEKFRLLKDIKKSYRPTQPLYGRSLFWFNSHTIKQKSEYSWNYYNQDSWEDSFPECGSNMQSPIDLKNDITDIEILQNELEFSIDYKEEKKFLLSFNDYGVRMTLTRKDADKIYFKDDHKTFIFQEAQFHWGRKSNEGSEHTINGRFFDLEMHLIHKSLDGEVAIIALLISEAEVCETECSDYLSKINDAFIEEEDSVAFNFSLLNTDEIIKHAYYKYEGSLTTPPCTESVTWYIFEVKFQLNPDKSPLREFRKLQMHNIRRQKDRNYRYIYGYIPVTASTPVTASWP